MPGVPERFLHEIDAQHENQSAYYHDRYISHNKCLINQPRQRNVRI